VTLRSRSIWVERRSPNGPERRDGGEEVRTAGVWMR